MNRSPAVAARLAAFLLLSAAGALPTRADVATPTGNASKSAALHAPAQEKSASLTARIAELHRLAALVQKSPKDDAHALRLARTGLAAPEAPVRSSAAALLIVLARSSRAATDVVVDTLLTSDEEVVLEELMVSAALGGEDLFIRVSRGLRRTVLEGTGPNHRVRARRVLLVLLRARQEGIVARSSVLLQPACFTYAGDGPVCVETELANLATHGQGGAKAALAVLEDSGSTPAARLTAANSLALTGVTPSTSMIESLVAASASERDRPARVEELLALAAFAERSPEAVGRLQMLLMTEKDCGLAESIALSLPSHDLRLALYKRLAGDGGERSVLIRQWVRGSPFWRACRP